ncbi:MAG: hypothetical protein COB30_016445 [Ectothiorhodospiraceae bacterium]|nr:hypothetical protein [Ectothiorhodospiraceae bacterium]
MKSVEALFSVLQLEELSFFLMAVKEGSGPFGIDTSIEGLNSQEVSVGIFYFLVASIVVFTIFVFMFMLKSKTKLKIGEKILFAWILFGVVISVIFGASQMLHGYLF